MSGAASAVTADTGDCSRFVLSHVGVQVDVTHLWTAVAAAIVAFSFIFKNAIATMFDSVIFLFVVHAFDVGDGILLNGDLHKVQPLPSSASGHIACPHKSLLYLQQTMFTGCVFCVSLPLCPLHSVA